MHILSLIGLLLTTGIVIADIDDPLHPKPHRVVEAPERFHTDRSGAKLDLPAEEDAFMFAVFGDRTGGPATGITVLREAVADVNLIEPDFVMTVGDLIDGYNETAEWNRQMQEFTSSMDALLMPWFPVAGNHDVYWRGEGERPVGEHEREYEMHFGPLWYAFEHKGSMFIVLYTDEGIEGAPKRFDRPETQKMSPEQFRWLESMLERGRESKHVFIFLHHPRWLEGGYGDDWRRVHSLLADAGNVRAVFAGHIHRMRYDGPRDGIEYVTMATVGGGQSGAVPEAGYLHHYDLVTVRDEQIAIASYPVGAVMDVRSITGAVSNDTRRLSELKPTLSGPVRFAPDRSVSDTFSVSITNPASREIEASISFGSEDSRWRMSPGHAHFDLEPGASRTVDISISRDAAAIDASMRFPVMHLDIEYLGVNHRYSIPRKTIGIELELTEREGKPAGQVEAPVTTGP
tara:strand:+ start:2872 stop:4248 length:1377 start_codon:yes stop_codon:yes gene_type:complete